MRFTAFALLLGLSSAAQAAEPDPYIFDVLALQPYKGNFARLVKDKATPDWVKAISIQGAGTAGPMRTVEVAGAPYRLDRVCKVDACAGNTLDVLWAPRGAKVWAALVEGGKAPVMLGDPKGAQAKELEAASGFAAPPSTETPVAAAAPAAKAADPDAYIFDVLVLQPYRGNFARLVKGRGVPDWVKAISVQGAGTAGPMKTVEVGGTPDRLDRVCKVDACAGNTLDVLWAPRGAKVWAALVEDGKAPMMLGDPKGPQAKALMEAATAAPAPVAVPASAAATPAATSPAPPPGSAPPK